MVTYDRRFHRVTLMGDMFGSTEIWTTGFAIATTAGGDIADEPTDAEAQAIGEAFATFWGLQANGANQYYRFTGCKVGMVSTDGSSQAEWSHYWYRPTALAGINNFATPHPQLSVVATLATTKQRGKGSKGRMYLPGLTASIDGTGKLGNTYCTQLANSLKTFLDAVNASTDVPGTVHLMSAQKDGVPSTPAESNPVASVRIGNVVDTQRRRRNQLVEQYVSATLA